LSSPLTNLEERIAKLEAAVEEVRAATREAHEATKALRQAGKEVRDLLAVEPTKAVAAVIEEAVKVGLDGFADSIGKARDDAIARTHRSFDELAGILLGYERRDEDSIIEAFAKRVGIEGTCPRCKGTVLERYLCARRQHYGTRVVGFLEERRLEVELGEVEARRHAVTELEEVDR
jgi:exonuclease VII small subunit